MQPTAREMQAMAAAAAAGGASQISLDDLRNGHGGGGVHDDFLDHMLSSLPPSAWPDLAAGKGPEDDGAAQAEGILQHQFGSPYDESAMLASRLRQHQISGGDGGAAAVAKQMVLQQLAGLRQGHHMMLQGMSRSPVSGGGDGMLLPLTLGSAGSGGDVHALLKAAANSAGGGDAGVFGGSFGSSLQQQQQHFQPHPQQQQQQPTMASQGYGRGGPGGAAQTQAGGGGGAPAPPRQRVRARRGQATDPHSIAERLRRERIAERMKALQELVPSANKTDKASMLDEIIDYVKFLQLQVKVLSMSRLGGAAAVAPLVADMSSEGRAGGGAQPAPAAPAGSDSLTGTEQQVAKLMEEDMGTAMQYLQGKGLCLMPVSLASAISTAACNLRPPAAVHHLAAAAMRHHMQPAGMNAADVAGAVPASPSMSALTAHSAMANGEGASQPKDAASVSNA